jgi:2-octaprenyl-6-methoxyphenol hydroxylase
MQSHCSEVVVVGGGPAGLTAAIALAAAGVETVVIAGRARADDNRTTALLAGSITALETLGAWQRCRPHAAPLRVMRIIDDTARLLRAPEVRFAASEIGLDAFGHNVENRWVVAALDARARELPALDLVEQDAEAVEVEEDQVRVRLESGVAVLARLAIGAEGRRSLCRAAAGIAIRGRSYRQTALTCNLGHTRPHQNVSTEFHTPTGPLTLVPLPEQRSSLVLVLDPDEAPRLATLPEAALADEIERRSHSILGKIEVEASRGLFPLVAESAMRFGARRIVLIGEAAHVMPPIGAQGLNLSLRDAATIGELAVDAHRDGGDVGAVEVTDRFDELRRADVTSRAVAVDLLNRSLLSDFLPLQGARGLGLFLIDRIGPLRRAVMREGVAPLISQPRLMRGEMLN